MNHVSIDYLKPVYRQFGPLVSNQAWRKTANLIDFIFSSPLATDYQKVIYRPNNRSYFCYKIEERVSTPYWHQALKIACIAVLVWALPRFTFVALLLGCALKVAIRSKEQFEQEPPPGWLPLPNLRLRAAKEPPSPQENVRKWLERWQCEAYFYLFLRGITEQEEVQPISGETIEIKIGEETSTYPMHFITQIPFFEAYLRWHPGNKIVLSENFHLSHQELKKVEQLIEGKDITKWDLSTLEHFGFLAIGEKKDISRFAKIQELLSEPIEDLSIPDKERLSSNPPSTKCPTFSMRLIESEITLNLSHEKVVSFLRDIENNQKLEPQEKHYQFNQIFEDYIQTIHDAYGNNKVQNNLLLSSDIISSIVAVVQEVPSAKQYVTILRLPPDTNYQQLNELIKTFPNLLWLQLTIFAKEIDISELPQHEKIRIFNIEGQEELEGDREQLNEKFPNCDIIEFY